MMKRSWKVWLTVATVILLTMTMALAEETSTLPDVKCNHLNRVSRYDATRHWDECADCGELMWEGSHMAICTAPNRCLDCGAPYSGNDIRHHTMVWESNSTRHRAVCRACGTVCDDWEKHYALCENMSVCAKCGKQDSFFGSDVRHAIGPWVSTNIETHGRFCRTCGAMVEVGLHARACDGSTCLVCNGEYTGQNVQHVPGADGICVLCGVTVKGSSSSSQPSGSTSGASSSMAKPADTAPGAANTVATVAAPVFHSDSAQQALIYAPRTGKASLRESASPDGKVLKQFMDGTVVTVLGQSGKYTQVSIQDMTGYVLTDALEMLDMAKRPLGEGMLTGNRNVSVRCDASLNALKVAAWPTGTSVIVWSVSDNGQWCEVEYENARVWVHADYLNIMRLYDYTAEAGVEA